MQIFNFGGLRAIAPTGFVHLRLIVLILRANTVRPYGLQFAIWVVKNPTVLGRAWIFSENRHPFVCFADISPIRGITRPYGLWFAVGFARNPPLLGSPSRRPLRFAGRPKHVCNFARIFCRTRRGCRRHMRIFRGRRNAVLRKISQSTPLQNFFRVRAPCIFRRPTRIGIRERQRKMRGVRAMEKLCAGDHFAVFFLFFADKFFHGFDGGHILRASVRRNEHCGRS